MALPSDLRAPAFQNRDAAVVQYAPLVKYVVGRLAIGLPAILDYEDILSYGTIGLIEALDRFDDSKGVKFETYAISRIRGSIIDALRALDRLPRSVRQKAKRLDQVTLAHVVLVAIQVVVGCGVLHTEECARFPADSLTSRAA